MTRLDPRSYRESLTREYTLPSGGTVLCRKPNLMRMLSNYDLQPTLLAIQRAHQVLGEAEDEQERNDREKALMAAFSKDGIAFGCAIICDGVTEPSISLQGKDGEFCVFDLDAADMAFLLDELCLWMGFSPDQLTVLAPFRDQSGPLRTLGALEGEAEQSGETTA